jgi:hypothetical protein
MRRADGESPTSSSFATSTYTSCGSVRASAPLTWWSRSSPPTTQHEDLPGGEKWRDYETLAIPHYWIADPEAHTISQYTHLGRRYAAPVVLRSGAALDSPLFPGLTVPVGNLFRHLRRRGR